ncbi:MAG: HEAT repeat domain-containing protein, partial [Methanothrix sp.]|nr:HEAT repeat domain-containing protein [Methanothrix sp.]
DADMRQAAASALGTTKNERAIDPLISKLDDSDAYVRQAAASALGTIKNERAIDPLILKLDDSDADVRQAAASALSAIKKKEFLIDQFILKLRGFLLRNLCENAEYGRHFSFALKDKAT